MGIGFGYETSESRPPLRLLRDNNSLGGWFLFGRNATCLAPFLIAKVFALCSYSKEIFMIWEWGNGGEGLIRQIIDKFGWGFAARGSLSSMVHPVTCTEDLFQSEILFWIQFSICFSIYQHSQLSLRLCAMRRAHFVCKKRHIALTRLQHVLKYSVMATIFDQQMASKLFLPWIYICENSTKMALKRNVY